MNAYYSFNDYLKQRFGEKIYKLSLSCAKTCPNRDGTVGSRGCIFCSAQGSGDFATCADMPVDLQIELAKTRLQKKCRCRRFIAYFQSFSSTYVSPDILKEALDSAVRRDDIAALSLATRPDCLENDILEILQQTANKKPLMVELGLQSTNPATVRYIRRGYDHAIYKDAVLRLHKIGAHVVTHMILGLPGETPDIMLHTADDIVNAGSDGIKLQLLHVLSGTDLAADFEKGNFNLPTMEEYIAILAEIIEHLPPDMVIHRLTGDGPKKLLIAPQWSADKKRVLNAITQYFREHDIHQGRKYTKKRSAEM